MADSPAPPLRGRRILDLTSGGYNLAGRLLSDLGAEVIAVEPPGGAKTRRLGPYARDQVDGEHSLPWLAYNAGKLGITLNLETRDGRDLFRELLGRSDALVESTTPGTLDGLGIGPDRLRADFPRLTVTSITPFGSTGPHAAYLATDLVLWSRGGMQYLMGDRDRPPVRISLPQTELLAAAQGAAGTLLALYHRESSGRGQRVDVSGQVAVAWQGMNAFAYPPVMGAALGRYGIERQWSTTPVQEVFACADGYVAIYVLGGPLGAVSMTRLVAWMDAEGAADDHLRSIDWLRWNIAELTPADVERVTGPIAAFIRPKRRMEVHERGIDGGMLMTACFTVQDLLEDVQLRAREFWRPIAGDNGEDGPRLPGPYARFSETPLRAPARAPRLGEHNQSIYQEELGLSLEEMILLRAVEAI